MSSEQVPVLVSHSMRTNWKQCERKVFFRYVAGIEVRQPPNPARIIGKAFHTGLELWRKDPSTTDPALKAAMQQLQVELQAAGVDRDEAVVECWRLRAYLAGYFERFGADVDRPGSWQVEAKLGNSGEVGFADTLWKDLKGGIWIWEDKTTGQPFHPDLPMALQLDEQLLNYALLLKQAGHRVAGAVYRQTLKTRKAPHKGESLAAFGDRLLAEYRPSPGMQRANVAAGETHSPKYREVVVEFQPRELEDYEHDKRATDNVLRDAIEQPMPLGHYRRNTFSCMGKFGPCDYLKICATRCDAGALNFKTNGKEARDGGKFQREIWGDSYQTGIDAGAAGGYNGDELPDWD